MGVDISSRTGEYFSANWWSWRPLYFISMLANEKYKLKLNMDNWDSNSGGGLRTKKQCIKLADAIEKYVTEDSEYIKELLNGGQRIQICLGCWVKSGTGHFYTDEDDDLNEQYKPGTFLFSPVVTKKGELVESAHSCSADFLEEWINFLRNSGGFNIY